MSRKEVLSILTVALTLYLMGGFRGYVDDAVEHGITAEPVFEYKYIRYELQHPATARFLEQARASSAPADPYQPADPAVAVLVGDPHYAVGLGIIGLGTLVALCRELVLRRRGRFRGDVMPAAWQGLVSTLKKPL